MVHSKYMQGGLHDDRNLGALTAYIMIAMLEAGVDRNVRVVTQLMNYAVIIIVIIVIIM